MMRVGIVGATGYTGLDLVRLLLRHPQIKITTLTSERYVGQPIWKVFPSVMKETDLVCQALDVGTLSKSCDFVFTALPHKTAMEVVPGLIQEGFKVVDLSADFRLSDPKVYEEWYEAHTAPALLKDAVYGIPELHREEIKKASLVANPAATRRVLSWLWRRPCGLICVSALSRPFIRRSMARRFFSNRSL